VKQESRLKEKNRYEMLMSQISPHFIFNTVNSIKIMTIDERTRNALEDLGDILHAVYDNRDGMTTVGQEISMLESYVKIMQMRFGNSFLYYNTVPTSLYLYEMPAFSLQPLVENAILHGVKDVHAGQIIVSAVEYEWDYIISVFNNGNSAEKEKIEKILQEPYNKRALTGIGLYNVDSRLKMLYGKSYGLIFNEQVRSGFEIWLRLPKKLIRDESGKQKNGDVQIIDS
jgi:sensor histidine kinase YesM